MEHSTIEEEGVGNVVIYHNTVPTGAGEGGPYREPIRPMRDMRTYALAGVPGMPCDAIVNSYSPKSSRMDINALVVDAPVWSSVNLAEEEYKHYRQLDQHEQ